MNNPRAAFDPDTLTALRNLVLNGYRITNPEGHDVTDVLVRMTEK